MNLNLHKNARTTPAIRQELRESTEVAGNGRAGPTCRAQRASGAARRPGGVGRPDRPHTTATPAVLVAFGLWTTFLLPLDDLLAVTREFLNPDVSRSGLDRCLRRQGVS